MIIPDFSSAPYTFTNYINASRQDLEEILRWRNSEEIRKWMTNTKPITLSDHLRFVETLRQRSDKTYFVVYRNGVMMASINLLEEEPLVMERGLFALPPAQGKGYMAEAERLLMEQLRQQGVKALTAKVKNDNLRSLRYHEKLGYQLEREDGDYKHFKLQLQ